MKSALDHRVLAVGPSLRQVAIDERLCPPTKMIVLAGGSTRGVDALVRRNPDGSAAAGSALRDTLGIPADVPVVGFVVRLVRDKGIVDLADARCRLRNPYPELRLLLVGPFEERDPVPPDADATIQADPRVR